MGVYSDYLNKGMTVDQLMAERKKMLQLIAKERNKDLLVYAADSMKAQQGAPVALLYDDLLPITDQLENLKGKAIDVILETPGGSGETAEDIVRILRNKYELITFIVPGMAKSAGAIMVMSGDEIMMDAGSSLGPIDAQIQFEGRQFSAEALIKGFEKIKEETDETKTLNRAYIPMLQRISPGDLQHAENALDFARTLVREWLCDYKFKNWKHHRTKNPGTPVTAEEKKQRAAEIADALCDHSRWLTHGRSIRMDDLRNLGVQVTDFSEFKPLGERIKRYHVLMKMLFNASSVFKIIETPDAQVLRFLNAQAQAGIQPEQGQQIEGAIADVQCGRCAKKFKVQVDFGTLKPLQPGTVRYPPNNMLVCDQCRNMMNLSQHRQALEKQMKRKVVTQ